MSATFILSTENGEGGYLSEMDCQTKVRLSYFYLLPSFDEGHFWVQIWTNLEKLGLHTEISGDVLLAAAKSLSQLKPSDSQAAKKSTTLLAELNKAAGRRFAVHTKGGPYWCGQCTARIFLVFFWTSHEGNLLLPVARGD